MAVPIATNTICATGRIFSPVPVSLYLQNLNPVTNRIVRSMIKLIDTKIESHKPFIL